MICISNPRWQFFKRSPIRDVLLDIVSYDMESHQKITISFVTKYKDVVLPEEIKERFPYVTHIVLEQGRFWNLRVNYLSIFVDVILVGKRSTIEIPFASVVRFHLHDNCDAMLLEMDTFPEKYLDDLVPQNVIDFAGKIDTWSNS